MTDAETQDRGIFPSLPVREQNDSIIMLGQSREKTILRLKDNCPGFGAGAAKPVLGFFRLNCGSDVNQNNVVENLTIDTGSGNPGAIGMRWNSANTGAIRNVTIQSGDEAGVTGLLCDVLCAEGLFEDVSIQGFDEGLAISAGRWGTIPTLEHASFSKQKRLGIRVANYSRFAARDVVVTGAPTALRVESSAHGVLLDSSFQGEEGAAAAIDLADGHLFARNIQTVGYASALARDGQSALASPRVEEYVSGPTLSTEPGTPAGSLRLPIEDPPRILPEADLAKWATASPMTRWRSSRRWRPASPRFCFPGVFTSSTGRWRSREPCGRSRFSMAARCGRSSGKRPCSAWRRRPPSRCCCSKARTTWAACSWTTPRPEPSCWKTRRRSSPTPDAAR
jgi:hypothetical protein